LHLAVVAILCAGFDLHAQTQGNLPNVIDGAIDGIIGSLGNGVIKWPENIAIGDTLAMCNNTEQAGGPFAISDTLGNSWTCTAPTQTPAPGGTNGFVNICYTKATFAGTDTITYAFPGNDGVMVGGRFSGLGAVDGSVGIGTLSGPGSGGTSTVATTQTTTVNNDLAISCGGDSIANSGVFLAPSTGEIIAHDSGNGYPVLSMSRTGTKGSQTVTYNTFNNSCGFGCTLTSFALQTLMFKPNTNISLADTVMPQAASGSAYSAQLHCIGGTAAQTYSVVTGTLPTGITLNTGTGALTSASVSGTTQTVGFQCADGTITSATDRLPITVGAAFNTPTIRSFVTNFNGVTGAVTGAVCGDMIHLLARGNDTHAEFGFVGAVSGSSNFITDTFSSPVQRMLLPIAGPPQTPIIDYAIGPLTQSGTDVITISNNQAASGGLPVSIIYDIANVQSVSDQGALAETIMQNGTLSASFTSVVPNTLLLTGWTSTNTPALGAVSLGAPFTPDSIDSDGFPYSVYGHALIASPGSTTASYTSSGASSPGEWGAVIVSLRPALPSTCPVPTGNGEKIRRTPF
jgi:hypothetical protein